MSDTMFPELQALRIEISDDVREAQFHAIVSALDDVALSPPSMLARARMAWRRWVVSLAAAGTVLVPVAAVASESAVPGDSLYPLKLTVERIQVLFDRDIDAEHRVDELERMLAGDAPSDLVDSHIGATFEVLVETVDRPDLLQRFDRAITQHRVSDERPDAVPSVDAETDGATSDHRPADTAPTDTGPTDTGATDSDPGSTTTTVPDADRQEPTTVPRTDDGATEPADTDRDPVPEATTTTHGPRDGGDAGDAAADDRP